jgi:hypothetical protein
MTLIKPKFFCIKIPFVQNAFVLYSFQTSNPFLGQIKALIDGYFRNSFSAIFKARDTATKSGQNLSSSYVMLI